jgi:hypothetical protein
MDTGSLTTFLASLGAWNWLIAAAALCILEVFAPGVFLLWFGIAAAVVGIVALNVELSLIWQLVLFGATSIASVLAANQWLRYGETRSDLQSLNVRGHQYIGQVFVVEDSIENGRGRIRVGDSLWAAEGPDTAVGARVRVTAVKGTSLVVEPV